MGRRNILVQNRAATQLGLVHKEWSGTKKEQVGDRQIFRNWKCRLLNISSEGSMVFLQEISCISAQGIPCFSAEMMLFPAGKISGKC